MESLSSYARQFLGQMEKPDVEVSKGFHLQFLSIRNQRITIHVPQLELLRRFMIIFDYYMRELEFRIARNVVVRLQNSR